ncbi:SDR family NAD(P)-dependent oxidoreductase [Nocardioides sp. LHG3406-4]|uniref:SDR family NAD(P)-dependent oxidoreductase n=1 Tax=Nocardioides sp. LHG3406-4 TaxID=2804575 RepID=UPI003CE7264D
MTTSAVGGPTQAREIDAYRSLFDLTGKTVVLFGAASGIGRECAYALAAHGARVLAADRDQSSVDELAPTLGNGSEGHAVDLLDGEAVDAFAERVGAVDALVFTPAINVRKLISDYTDEDFQRVTELNLGASFRLLRAFGPRMAANGGGSIVGFSSIRATTVEQGQGVYAATKAGLEMLLRTAACEFGPQNVRANAIRPGVVETALTEPLRANEDWNRAYAAKSALGRWARPSELTGAVVYLVSDASTFVTGSMLTVDGGWTAQDGRYTPPM